MVGGEETTTALEVAMIFEIGRSPNTNLSEHYEDSGWVISTDKGWDQHSHGGAVCLHKGLQSNSCTIAVNDSGWILETPMMRSFPLWSSEDGECVTNCRPLHNKIHNFNKVSHDGKLKVEYEEPEWISDVFNQSKCLEQSVLEDKICDLLVGQASALTSTGLMIKIPNTGGVDTTMIRSVLDYAGVEYTLADAIKTPSRTHQHMIDQNKLAGGNFWGYQQMADTSVPHILATGFWGDEYLQRNPLYTHLYLQYFDKDLTKAYESAGQSYMRNFFDHHYRAKVKDFDCTDTPRRLLQDMMLNDFQMWHIDECLTWTPLGDIELLRLSLQATPETAIDQCVNAGLSRSIISRLNSKNLDLLDTNKNRRLPISKD